MLQFTDLTQRIHKAWECRTWVIPSSSFKYAPLALHDTQPADVELSPEFRSCKTTLRTQKTVCLFAFVLSLSALFTYIVLLTANRTKEPIRTSPATVYPPENRDSVHPMLYLTGLADARFASLRSAQSTTLTAAVTEYRRRYDMPPPPHFDRWYQFAIEHGTELIDEFDDIADSLNLFWGMEPNLIRLRVREALGHDNSLMGVTIRDSQINVVGSGQDDFQIPATREMLSKFSKWLPDMDLAFNVNDESRVLVPHEDVSRLHSSAVASIRSVQPVSNSFSRPDDLGDGQNFDSVPGTRFNRLDHQQTFAHARMSCPPDSPARSLTSEPQDAELGLNFEGITFIDNITAFSDICLSPSVRDRIGLFNKPNVFAVSHDLIPIFTPSKLSTFHDILYPSPYYYAERTKYDESYSVEWNEKVPKLYWRGATSGGYSEGGTWRSLLRQSILSKLGSDEGTTQVLIRETWDIDSEVGRWTAHSINRTMVVDRFDAKFTEIKQCAPKDCAEMRSHFGSHPHISQEESWKNRYLLDMDGNALSGRFYALLKSFSLPLKVAYYREWHMSRIIPWKHYVPLTSTTDEYTEMLRYFEEDSGGQKIAKDLALQGREWVKKVARKTDMEVYMFRLLLEYARVIDDNRLLLGFQ